MKQHVLLRNKMMISRMRNNMAPYPFDFSSILLIFLNALLISTALLGFPLLYGL